MAGSPPSLWLGQEITPFEFPYTLTYFRVGPSLDFGKTRLIRSGYWTDSEGLIMGEEGTETVYGIVVRGAPWSFSGGGGSCRRDGPDLAMVAIGSTS